MPFFNLQVRIFVQAAAAIIPAAYSRPLGAVLLYKAAGCKGNFGPLIYSIVDLVGSYRGPGTSQI